MALPPLLQPKTLEKLCRSSPARLGSTTAAQRTAQSAQEREVFLRVIYIYKIWQWLQKTQQRQKKGNCISSWKALIYRDPMTPSVAVKNLKKKKFVKDIHSRELRNMKKGERQLRKMTGKTDTELFL